MFTKGSYPTEFSKWTFFKFSILDCCVCLMQVRDDPGKEIGVRQSLFHCGFLSYFSVFWEKIWINYYRRFGTQHHINKSVGGLKELWEYKKYATIVWCYSVNCC